MRHFPPSTLKCSLSLFFLYLPCQLLASCNNSCGLLAVRYPLGTGNGCGSPLFFPSITCSSDGGSGGNQLFLNTHTGTYPITSISYSTSTLTISPSTMSTCLNMLRASPSFGLNWTSAFQLGPSIFILLGCSSSTSSSICDMTHSYLCESINSCPGLPSLGLPIFAPASSCCVYSPASLGPKDELDLSALNCAAYTSVISYGDVPTDPLGWEYGVSLKFGQTGFEEYGAAELCGSCETSGGVCGYIPPKNYFTCVCPGGINNSVDCSGQSWTSFGTLYQPSLGILLLSSAVHLFARYMGVSGDLQGLN